MPPKVAGNRSPWVLCDSCQIYLTNEQIEQHSSNCPPDYSNVTHPFIYEQKLYGIADYKSNEDINGLSSSQKEKMVFLSQSVFQLCSIAIEDWVVIENLKEPEDVPFARIAWPTKEKSLFSVLFPKKGLDHPIVNKFVKVEKIDKDLNAAIEIIIVPLPAQRSFEFTSELQLRLQKSNSNSLFCEGNIVKVLFYGTLLKFQIKSITSDEGSLEQAFDKMSLRPYKFFKTTDKTIWKIYKNEEERQEIVSTNLLERLGGLSEEISEIESLMRMALSKDTKFQVSRAVLLFGSSGTGKTTIAGGLARKSGAHIVSIDSTQLYGKSDGKIEELLKSLFEEAIDRPPCVIVMDEVDVLCPSRSSRLSDTDRRIVSSVLTFLDDLNGREDCQVFVIATTNKRDALDPAFRRCGRFDQEIEIPIPNPQARYEILQKRLENQPNEISSEDLKDIANSGHGYVGADLVTLCSQAGLNAFKKGRTTIKTIDLSEAMKKIRPSAMRAVQIEVPNVKWADIGGQKDLKLILKQAVEWPLKYPEKFTKMGITPPRGVLMFGPPGCSKTMIAKALATESGLNFLSIKGPEIFNKWVGESEKAIREIFQKARQVAPSIVFFDEIDAIGGERSTGSTASVQERVLAQLLTELDGVTPLGDVTIIAATNRPDKMDKALLRPGRLDRIVYVPLPNDETRREIFKIKFGKMPVKNVDAEELVLLTEGYSGAEVNAVCHEAAMMALEEDFDCESVEMRHFLKALHLITPRTPSSLINIYENYIKNKE